MVTVVGMTKSDDDISNEAVEFFLESACSFGIGVYILLENSNESFRKKLSAYGHFRYSSKGNPRSVESSRMNYFPMCLNWIDIEVFPDSKDLMSMTHEYLISAYGTIPNMPQNNPLQLKRIANIKRAREYQRQFVANKLKEREEKRGKQYQKALSVIVMMDVDMLEYPHPSKVIKVADKWILPSSMDFDGTNSDRSGIANANGQSKYHAICSNGIMVTSGQQQYYDTFATVLLPNTWLYPRKWRSLSQKQLEGEDEKLATLRQEDTLLWFLDNGTVLLKENEQNYYIGTRIVPVPVRSCFGGLTIYRSDVWMNELNGISGNAFNETMKADTNIGCRYDMYDEACNIYSSKAERHACEHVIFHECLRRRNKETDGIGAEDKSFRIAVLPDLFTLYHFTG